MSWKRLIRIAVVTLAIFLSYGYVQTLGSSAFTPDKTFYTLKTYNISPKNQWAAFKDEGEGHFFIHPGERKASKGVFRFKKSADLIWDFSIDKRYKDGKIGITIFHNKKKREQFILTRSSPKQILLSVAPGDRVEIVADKAGKTTNDHGKLVIYSEGSRLEQKAYLIPFLWSIFFIFLLGKGHGYLALNSYLIFLLLIGAERLNFGMLTTDEVLSYSLLMYAFTLFCVWIYQVSERINKLPLASLLGFILAALLYVTPLVFMIYALNFESRVTPEILYAVFQTNFNESKEYVADFIATQYIGLFLAFTFMVAILLYRQEKQEMQKLDASLLFFMIITFFTIGVMNAETLRLPRFVGESLETYMRELASFKKIQAQRDAGKISFRAEKKEKGETYVVIIGESLNKHHMGLYGYTRETTPLLSGLYRNGGLIRFENVYANHVHTVPVLSLALTEANQYNGKTYYQSLSIIDILKKADIETYWLTNQTIYGAWDNMVSVIGTSADHVVALNKHIGTGVMSSAYDGDLIKHIDRVLQEKTRKNRVIFVHLYGNHQRYEERYPKEEFTVFKTHVKQGELGKKAFLHSRNVNTYDNSVRYNDYVVGTVLKHLQRMQGVLGFLYFSDHADDVVNRLAHTIDKFTFEMTQIPMLAWFSEGYKVRYAKRYEELRKHQKMLFSNDMMYNTMIGIMGVRTSHYDSEFDLSSDHYSLEPSKALVNHGKKYYTDKDNFYYWQKYNVHTAKAIPKSPIIMAEHINTLGMLEDAWQTGLRAFSVDIDYDVKGFFKIAGSRKGELPVSLERFLSTISSDKIVSLKLRIGHMEDVDIDSVLEWLQILDQKYHLREKVWIESRCIARELAKFKNAGWRTVCSIDKQIVRTRQESLCRLLREEQIDMLSFSQENMLEVKVLEKRCTAKTVDYAISHVPSLDRMDMVRYLRSDWYENDPQVRMILTTFTSQFSDR